MKKLFILFLTICIFAVSSCIQEEGILIEEQPIAGKEYIPVGKVYGDADVIQDLIDKGATLEDLSARAPGEPAQGSIGCTESDIFGGPGDPGDPGDGLPPAPLKPTSKISKRYFQTYDYDGEIEYATDINAVEINILYGDVQCYEPGYNPYQYINVTIDNNVPSTYAQAVGVAIGRWNAAINANPNNSIFVDNPHIYLRIAPQNLNDLGNILVKVYQASEMKQTNYVAETNKGSYNTRFWNGAQVTQYNIGENLKLNANFQSHTLEGATTLLVHEFSHAMGFLHPYEQEANIYGTDKDAPSAMGGSNPTPGEFTFQDLLAIDRVFNVSESWILMECGGL